MRQRLVAALVAAGSVVLVSCSDESGSPPTDPPATSPATTAAPSTQEPTTDPPSTEPPSTPTSDAATTTSSSTSTTTSTTVPPATTVPPTTTTTPPAPVPGQPNPACTTVIAAGDSLTLIAERTADPAVTAAALQLENGITDPNVINAGAQIDVCPGNGVDDITGAPRVPPTVPDQTAPPTTPPPVAGLASGVPAQQQKLNELFAPYGMRPLGVDGQSGRLTRQLLCAARLALNMPVSRDDMVPGSPEEQSLMAVTALPIPATAPVQAARWALLDQTCQIMFVGEGSDRLVFVFPTSTGSAEFPTRNQQASAAFRYNPARANGGWHDSSDYPASGDNPLNGNMYKPIYFDRGQAIHGANTVPTSPASHGCARLRVADQDALVSWLGLQDVESQLWDARGRINLTVTVQGRY